MKTILGKCVILAAIANLPLAAIQAANWPARSEAVPITQARGYVNIPGAEVPRDPRHVYKALLDVKDAPKDPAKPHDALVRAGSLINALRQGGVPAQNIRFDMIFHGEAVDALLTDERYRAKYNIANPNHAILAELEGAGVKIFVCGQYMAHVDLPRAALVPQAKVAESATLVIIRYANDGYAILN